ncbi:ribokinase [Mesorhizobium sp. VNQ89]|uniref:ribokinase n=1 Tax=Mesorhizobium quangtriensis TaxID=3157709 RepID=UPI0032B74CC1
MAVQKPVVILGVFVADTAYRAARAPRMGETILGSGFKLGPGGKGSNQAVAAGRLGADVTFITRLGRDPFADMALATWKDAGVKAAVIETPESYTGAAYIFVEETTGNNAIIVAPGAASLISSADIDANAALIRSAGVFVTQLEQPIDAAERALEIAREAGVTTILNPAPAAKLPDRIYKLSDYLTPNETETEELTGMKVESVDDARRAGDRLLSLGVGAAVITLGDKGALLHTARQSEHVPAISAGPVVETTGAGDAFNGGFAAALARGVAPLEAVRFACAVAGISVTRPGTAPSMPTRDEVERLL